MTGDIHNIGPGLDLQGYIIVEDLKKKKRKLVINVQVKIFVSISKKVHKI